MTMAIVIVFLMTMMVPVTIGPSLSAGAVPGPRNSLVIELSPGRQEANVSHDQSGVATFEGTVAVGQSYLVTSEVTLSASCVWPAIVSPSTMEFTGPGDQTFTLTVVVPPRTSSLTVGQVRVSGTYKAPGMPVETAQASATVTVSQYHKTTFTYPERNLILDRGSTGSLDINVQNEGNGRVTYEFAVDAPEGLSVTLSQFNMELGQAEKGTVMMNVSAGIGAPWGVQRFTVLVNEVGTSPRTFSEHVFTVRVATPTWVWVAVAVLLLAAIGVAVALWKGRLPALRRALSRMRGHGETG